MKAMPRIGSVMTPFPYSVGPDDSLRTARRMMAEHRIRHLPVMIEGRPAGVITDQDMRRAAAGGAEGEPRVGDLTMSEACEADMSAPLDLVLSEMAERHLDSALVLKAGKLVGIFTATDACREFAALLRREAPRRTGRARPEAAPPADQATAEASVHTRTRTQPVRRIARGRRVASKPDVGRPGLGWTAPG